MIAIHDDKTAAVTRFVLPYRQLPIGSSPGGLLTRTGLDPSAPIGHTWKFPSRLLANAVLLPSGDHPGRGRDPCSL